MAGLATDLLGTGIAADRPAAPDVSATTLSFWLSTDTKVLSAYDWDEAAWRDVLTGVYSAAEVDAAIAAATTSGTLNGVVSGGQVVWESDYIFRVSAASYYINGVLYTSTEQTVTLTAADATLDRIDIIVLDDTGTADKVTGTAAAQPSEPDYDSASQLYLKFVLVTAATTAPPTLANENVYLENTEWTASTSGSGFNANSTNNPYAGTKCIEGTTVANAAYVSLDHGATFDLADYSTLGMFIRSKATWANKRTLRVQWYDNGVAKGNGVTIATGFFGFDSSITADYQQVAIPLTAFAVPAGTLVDQLRITDIGGSIGFYIDNIVLQAFNGDVGGGGSSGISQEEADARYLKLTGGTLTGDLAVPAEVYGAGWDGSNEVPTKNDVYDKIEAVVAGVPGTYNDEMAQDAVGAMVDATLIYVDATPALKRAPITGHVTIADGSNAAALGSFTKAELSAAVSDGDPLYVGDTIKPTESIIIACSDETTAITTGTAKVTFRMPYAFTVSAVRASVTTAPTGSTILIDINESGSTILSTKLMIDASEKTSTTAATPYVLSDTSLADDAEITIDFDQVGSTIAGAGVKVYLIGTRT